MYEEYLTCNVNLMHGVFVTKARRLDEEEKTHYAKWFREIAFVATEKLIELDYVKCEDVFELLKNREKDGQILSDSGMAYIINQEEWNELLRIEKERREKKEEEEKQEQIKECIETIEKCEAAEKLYTLEEAKQERSKYNNLYNEGGEGYIPHFYTIEEYEFAKSKLDELQKK